jgi:hypothetical protein
MKTTEKWFINTNDVFIGSNLWCSSGWYIVTFVGNDYVLVIPEIKKDETMTFKRTNRPLIFKRQCHSKAEYASCIEGFKPKMHKNDKIVLTASIIVAIITFILYLDGVIK